MAAPVYSQDLTTITEAESTTGWGALGGGASGLSASPDLSMQGTNCVDKQISASEKGQYYDPGANQTINAGRHVYVWLFNATPGLVSTLALRGLAVIIGSASNAYCQYHVEGNDTYGATGRAGRCYPIDPSVKTSNTGSAPYRTLVGSPTANNRVFGGTMNATGTVKGANLGVDAIRHGTGAFITAGDSGTPATFAGYAAQNDSSSNRWGILTELNDSSFELQGGFVIGQNNAGTPTLAYFSDSNKNIFVVDTPHAASDFTKIVIDHASTEVFWDNISIQALGTTNRGRIIVNNASSSVEINGGVFSGIGITTLRAGCTVTGATWQQAGQISQNGATLTDCIISNSFEASALLSDNPSLVSGCRFVSDGTGHAIEITTPGTYSLSSTIFTGYAGTNGSTGNEAIYNNSGGAVTINVSDGASPSVRNGSGASTTVNNTVALTISANVSLVGAEIRVYDNDNSPAGSYGTELAGTESNGSATYVYSGSGGNSIVLQIMKSGYEEYIQALTMPGANQGLEVVLRADVNS